MSDLPAPDLPTPAPDLPPTELPTPGEGPLPGPGDPPIASGRAFDPRMLEALVCPQTHAALHWDAARQELVSRAAHLAYPVRDGIPVMLASEARAL